MLARRYLYQHAYPLTLNQLIDQISGPFIQKILKQAMETFEPPAEYFRMVDTGRQSTKSTGPQMQTACPLAVLIAVRLGAQPRGAAKHAVVSACCMTTTGGKAAEIGHVNNIERKTLYAYGCPLRLQSAACELQYGLPCRRAEIGCNVEQLLPGQRL